MRPVSPRTLKLIETVAWIVFFVGGLIFIDPILDQAQVWLPSIFTKAETPGAT